MDTRLRILALCLAFFAAPAAAEEQAFDRITAGTGLRVQVFGYPELTREATISPTGLITLPLAGDIEATGKTPAELDLIITKKLNEGYVVNPEVTVEILSYPPVYITGLAARPGAYPFAPGLTVRQAVALGGGFAARARTSSVTILRSTAKLEGDMDTPVLPGDTIDIGRRWF